MSLRVNVSCGPGLPSNSLSLGMTMRVSTDPRKASMASAACNHGELLAYKLGSRQESGTAERVLSTHGRLGARPQPAVCCCSMQYRKAPSTAPVSNTLSQTYNQMCHVVQVRTAVWQNFHQLQLGSVHAKSCGQTFQTGATCLLACTGYRRTIGHCH